MAEYLIQGTTLDAIADAINAKTGGSSAMTPAEMVTAIGSISGGGGGNALISDFLTVYKETVEVGENTVSNSQQYQRYLGSLVSIPGNFLVMAIHPKDSYYYNEWATGSGNIGYRYRSVWQNAGWNNSDYDAIALAGTVVDVYTLEVKNPSSV